MSISLMLPEERRTTIQDLLAHQPAVVISYWTACGVGDDSRRTCGQ